MFFFGFSFGFEVGEMFFVVDGEGDDGVIFSMFFDLFGDFGEVFVFFVDVVFF